MRHIRDYRIGPNSGDDYDLGTWAMALDRANIPARYRAARTDSIGAPQLREWIAQVTANPGSWLGEGLGFMLCGQLRTGKSCLAGILAMDAVARCERVLWAAAREVPGIMFRDGVRNEELHDRLVTADLLIIDDLGSEGYSMERAGGSALEGAMRTTYDNQGSLLVTSNLGATQLRGHYPEPMVSVLERMTSLLVVENDQWDAGPGRVSL